MKLPKTRFSKNVKKCLDYIIEFEETDYKEWCLDGNLDPDSYSKNTNHVFAAAVTGAAQLKAELEQLLEYRQFVFLLEKRFPGLSSDEEVNGGDLVEWLSHMMHGFINAEIPIKGRML